MSIEQARKTVAALNADIAGPNPAESIDERRSEITLADFFVVYYERHSSGPQGVPIEDIEKSERHIDTNRYGVNLAKLRLSDITARSADLPSRKDAIHPDDGQIA